MGYRGLWPDPGGQSPAGARAVLPVGATDTLWQHAGVWGSAVRAYLAFGDSNRILGCGAENNAGCARTEGSSDAVNPEGMRQFPEVGELAEQASRLTHPLGCPY